MPPLVSIIIPTYNRAHLIGETIDGVLLQTYQNWECIIVDDGSTDMTYEIVKKYIEDDRRFQFYERPANRPKGASACRNYGFEKSIGEFIQYLDSDDIISNNKFEKQVKALKLANSIAIATSKWGRFTNLTEEISWYENLASYDSFGSLSSFLDALALSKGYFPIHSYLIPRKLIEKAGKWDENLRLNDDGEFMSRIFIECENYIHISASYALYRTATSDNLSSYSNVKDVRKSLQTLKKIESRLVNSLKITESSYIEYAKMDTYRSLKRSQPKIILRNLLFFHKQIRKEGLLQFFKLIIGNVLK